MGSVLLALDHATCGGDMLQAAISLAADLETELRGLYVEDDTVLRIAALPFAQEVLRASATVRRLDAQTLRQAMHRAAEQIRQQLERQAASAQVRFSFGVESGHFSQRALLATADNDVLVFCCRNHVPRVRPPLAMRPRPAPLPLLVLFDRSPRGTRTLTTAAAVARNHSRPIILVILAHESDSFHQLAAIASGQLTSLELAHTLLPQPVATAAALIRAAVQQRPDLLLINRDSELLSVTSIEAMVEQLDCPIVLV
jgi:hypothetical protein